MEPISESVDAADELDPLAYDDDLLDQLHQRAAEVSALVPACVGMSVTMLDEGITLTLVATDRQVAALDSVQYLGGGPCIAAVETGAVLASDAEVLDEEQWTLFAQASAARGVLSTLSMPVRDAVGAVVGGINLYGSAVGCFDDHHEDLAGICGAWAGGAVLDADLTFSTRNEARRAPSILRDRARVDAAVGLLGYRLSLSPERARSRLESAATSAGLTPGATAQALLDLLGGDQD